MLLQNQLQAYYAQKFKIDMLSDNVEMTVYYESKVGFVLIITHIYVH